MNTKKVIIPIIISIATLILLTVGATYAYFSVSTNNNFGTKTITTSAESIGNVALSTGSNLILDLSAKDMMNQGSDLAYYASSSGTTTTQTIEKIGTATVTGEGIYNCTYKITMDDNSNSMYDVFQGMNTKSAGQIILTVNGTEYDFNTTGLFSKEISGTMYGLTSAEARDISASLKIVNKTSVDQSALAGSNITITFKATSFECNAVEDRLPSAYQEVEYLKTTGSQYINTGYLPSRNVKIDTTFSTASTNTSLWGASNDNNHRFKFFVNTSYGVGYRLFSNTSIQATTVSSTTITADTKYNFVFDVKNKEFYIDGVKKATLVDANGVDINYPIYIFANNVAGSAGTILSGNLYGFKLFNNDILVRNMVPCYRKSDNVKGMYDLIENKFYTNAGTGTFEAGNNI